MAHQLDFIKRNDILKALEQIDNGIVPKNNEWSEYWINYRCKQYQFKYVVEAASTFTNKPIKTTDFHSNDSSRNYIAALGFHIIFKSHKIKQAQANYWVGASLYGYYGNPKEQVDMYEEFIKDKYWRTDHDITQGEGLKIYNELKKVQINDRICIRYFDKQRGQVLIAAIGTVSSISSIDDGKLGVIWDYNPPQYRGIKPSGVGSGNWWKTLVQLKKHSDIQMIFGEVLVEKRVARLAWNDLGWVMPSGRYGKSEHEDTHEAKHGYGHEEWLFDISKIIDGFHYGFLEPIRKKQEAHTGKTYDVWLYSIHGETKKRYWVGEITNLVVIDNDEANAIRKIYVANGWIDEMQEQIRSSSANPSGFSEWKGVNLFNVKFKPADILVNDPYYELPKDHVITDQSRYVFAHFTPEFELPEDAGNEDDFGFMPPGDEDDDNDSPEKKTHIREPKAVEIIYLHKAISRVLTKTLRKEYGKNNVTREHRAGYGANKVDIVVSHNNSLIFYEIKTYNSIKTSIREALGQLIEYCFYPNLKKADELIIVTQIPVDDKTQKYFKHLRETFGLNIWYQSFDLKTMSISEKC